MIAKPAASPAEMTIRRSRRIRSIKRADAERSRTLPLFYPQHTLLVMTEGLLDARASVVVTPDVTVAPWDRA
jgi:hypothetical protein